MDLACVICLFEDAESERFYNSEEVHTRLLQVMHLSLFLPVPPPVVWAQGGRRFLYVLCPRLSGWAWFPVEEPDML